MFGQHPAEVLLGPPLHLDIMLGCYIAEVERQNYENKESKDRKNHEDELFSEALIEELKKESERYDHGT
jgi:hypothetical protein